MTNMIRTAAFQTLGCKVNTYETEAMEQQLKEHGYEIVPFFEKADVYIINTCSVTNIADRKSRQMLHRAKKKNQDAVVVAVGCYVQAAEAEVLADEAVDLVIGNNKKNELPQLLEAYFERCENAHVIDIAAEKEYETLEISRIQGHTRAYIKVQDGCNQFCSYCIIPYTRGRVRSRKPEDVLAEVSRLAAQGTKEIVLTGIHLSSYGVDLEEKITLLTLIQTLHEVEGILRIRLGSLEPRIITEAFALALQALPKVCPHFHLSLQSGSDATLKRMNRRYDTSEYYSKCLLLREVYDNPAITTDVIVGFPGETEAEFEETKQFLQKVDFFEMHIFQYSRRKGTVADQMENQVPDQIKAKRSAELLALEKEMSRRYREHFRGKKVSLLLEESITVSDKGTYMVGHTPQYVKGAVATNLPSNCIVTGQVIDFLYEDILNIEEEE